MRPLLIELTKVPLVEPASTTTRPLRPLTRFASEELFDFDWSRDGRQIVCTRGIYNSEAVLIKNFTER